MTHWSSAAAIDYTRPLRWDVDIIFYKRRTVYLQWSHQARKVREKLRSTSLSAWHSCLTTSGSLWLRKV